MQLNVSNLSFSYPGSANSIISGLTATFPQGWTAIVGDNGCGKTTLGRLACGLLRPSSGTVSRGLVAAYCAQDATEEPPRLDDFAYAYDQRALALRATLGIDDEWLWHYGTLSGGQQKRIQLACALWAEPDVLVVDEPTNHLDASARKATLAALAQFGGVGLLVSHDRDLIDALCSQCLCMGDGAAVMRPGGYTQAAGQADLERSSAQATRDAARRERERLAREAERRRQEAARSKGRLSLRGSGKHDSSTRDKLRKARVTGKDAVASRQASRMEARLAGADAAVAAAHVRKRYDGDLWLDARPARRKVLVHLPACELAMGERTLAVPELYVGNTDHIALVGQNGGGKTTLVKALMKLVPSDIACLYVPQEPTEQERSEALGRLRTMSPAQRGKVLSVVAQLNSDPDSLLAGNEVSPGELRKLMLALGVLEAPGLIVMDEPTNHLDLHSVEALERMLAAFPGALLLVSHDLRLLGAATDVTWRVEDGAVRCGPGLSQSSDGFSLPEVGAGANWA